MVDDPIITIADFRRLFCVAGTAKRMVEAGIDFRAFVQNGLPASQLMGKGHDALIERIIEAKRAAENLAVTTPPVEES